MSENWLVFVAPGSSGPDRALATHFTGERSTFASNIHNFDELTSSQTNDPEN